MTDYTKLVQALRCVEHEKLACPDCTERDCYANSGRGLWCRVPLLLEDAAAAIEALEARLGEAENSVERWKDMYLTKHEPKRGEWIEENRRPRSSQFVCSECHRTAYDPQPTRDKAWRKRCRYAYCPNCGAKMEVQDA